MHSPLDRLRMPMSGETRRIRRGHRPASEGVGKHAGWIISGLQCDLFHAALAEVRRSGVCLSRDETTVGASSVAAPVFGPERSVIAAVSVVVPSRIGNLTTLVPAVRAACMGISRAYGSVTRKPDRARPAG